MGLPELPDKPYYRIGEVAAHLGVEPHVLRFWEQEFPQLKPRRAPSGHRIFLPPDVDLLSLIQRMLHQEGFTIAGARRQLQELAAQAGAAQPETSPKQAILRELKDILKVLERE